MAVAAFGQQPVPRPYGGCYYGCGPFIPLVTTPEISLQQFSPNPVGATNATTGLIAGATNSTLSQVQGSTSSVYTVAVWYQGGAPMITPEVNLWPETIGREGRPMHDGMREERMREERARQAGPREARPREERLREERSREEHGPRPSEEARGNWTYFTGPPAEGGFRKAGHVYNNEDVTRQNDKNGTVKYDDKTEKL
jgi:hypothetical protein